MDTKQLSEKLDGVISIFSPRAAVARKAYRFQYDAIDGGRIRKNRRYHGGTGDNHLDEMTLSKLRETSRDLSRNNALAVGLLKTERDGVVGRGVKMQARSKSGAWNVRAERLWRDEMLDVPCDVTGRYGFNAYLRKAYLSYRRDGDFLTVLTDNGLQAIEGEQLGTPYGKAGGKYFDIHNGIAYSKTTGKVVGYYIGTPNKWGYINQDGYRKYDADVVHHMFNAERFSQSRGEPALTPSIHYIEQLGEYLDMELLAAKIQACFTMFIAAETPAIPPGYPNGSNPTGETAEGKVIEKIEPGMILRGRPGERATPIGQTNPNQAFEPFVKNMLMLIGRPLCMPLMLVTQSFEGATFMNARIAYQKVQEQWMAEQETQLKPFASRVWREFITRMVREGRLRERSDQFEHEVICNRWPYVDPLKEAKADEAQLAMQTITRTEIRERQGGGDWQDTVVEVRKKEEKALQDAGLSTPVQEATNGDENSTN